ncbi:MAG TPA: M48 family metallopeptidase [Rectinemataceae bacterium]|nr:M48 family metallopeptidase [Rectinemataceae bacterium]
MDMLATQAISQGLLDNYQATMLKIAAKAAVEASRQLNPEEEYYVGRAVAANIFATYRPYNCPELNAYINMLGQGLALYSSRPEIYAGYRFIVLDSWEINAFASPGGHILVTRGLLRKAQSEDELAAALAHEIAHVSLGHGLASVQGARLTKIASEFAINAGNASGGDIAAFTSAFGDSISELAKIIVISGYSQTYEFQADLEARNIIASAGYDLNALSRLIGHLPRREEGNTAGFAVTHPEPASRQEALRSSLPEQGKVVIAKKVWPVTRDEEESLRTVDPVLASYVRSERFETLRGFF